MKRFTPIRFDRMQTRTKFTVAFSIYWIEEFSRAFEIEDDIWFSVGRVADPTDMTCGALVDRVNGHWIMRFGEVFDLSAATDTIIHEVGHLLDWKTAVRCKNDHSESHALYEYELRKYFNSHPTIERDVLIQVYNPVYKWVILGSKNRP